MSGRRTGAEVLWPTTQEIARGAAVNEAILGDVDNDGDLDVVMSCWQQPGLLWRNDGSGVFAGPEENDGPDRHTGVAFADFDSDNDLDIVFSVLGGGVKVFKNDAHGRFEKTARLDVERATSVALGDLNGDRIVDAFITTSGGGDRVFFNDGLGDFRDSGQLLGTRGSEAVVLVDFDRDGDLDALTVATDWGTTQPRLVWQNRGSDDFGVEPSQMIKPNISLGLAFGDLDGDGRPDIYFANYNDRSDEVWFNKKVGP